MAMPSGRCFGWVIGGPLTGGLAADGLATAWEQEPDVSRALPVGGDFEGVAGSRLPAARGLPAQPRGAARADETCLDGDRMAYFAGPGSERHAVLSNVGWDVNDAGLAGAPRVNGLVSAERDDRIVVAIRYLGLAPQTNA